MDTDKYSANTLLRNSDSQNQILADQNPEAFDRAADQAGFGTIDGSRLGTQSNIAVPNPIKNNVAQNNLGAQVGAVSNIAETNFALGSAEQNAVSKPDPKKGLTDRIMEVIGLQKNQGAKTLQVQEEEGVFEKKTLARKLENDIIAKTRAYEKQAEQIRLNSQGKFGGAVEQELNELDRLKNSELADMAIQYKVAAGDYNQAMEIATAKIEAEFEPLKNEIASLTQLYNLYQNDLSESEKMEVQAQIQAKQNTLNFERQKEMKKYEDELERANPMFALEMKLKNAQIDAANRSNQPSGNDYGTLNGKPQNATQAQANGYGDRMMQSNVIISNIGSKFTRASDSLGKILPNALKSGDRQSYEQAQKNFVTAVLRRESGAVISPSEFKTEAEKYFPQPGDYPVVVKQKADARNTAINNIYREANALRPVLPGEIIKSEDGKQYRVGSDGETLEEV